MIANSLKREEVENERGYMEVPVEDEQMHKALLVVAMAATVVLVGAGAGIATARLPVLTPALEKIELPVVQDLVGEAQESQVATELGGLPGIVPETRAATGTPIDPPSKKSIEEREAEYIAKYPEIEGWIYDNRLMFPDCYNDPPAAQPAEIGGVPSEWSTQEFLVTHRCSEMARWASFGYLDVVVPVEGSSWLSQGFVMN